MKAVVLSFGANCGNRDKAVEEAMQWCSRFLENFRKSSIYETDPFGHPGPRYMNSVAIGFYKSDPDYLESECKRYELAHGRNDETRRNNLVPIDIDIVMIDDVILRPRDFRCEFFQKGYREVISDKP